MTLTAEDITRAEVRARYRDAYKQATGEDQPPSRHVDALLEIQREHGEGWEVAVNWDRRWGEREGRRHMVGYTTDRRLVWAHYDAPPASSDRRWSDEELRVLREHYRTKGAAEVARRLGRTVAAVQQKARRSGV